MNRFKTALAACGLAAASTSASAHEFWLEPTAFTVPVGAHIGVYVCNGSGFEGWSLPRDPRRIEEFVALGPDGSQPVVGLDGSQPAGLIRFTSPGGYIIAYQSNRALTVQPDEKFDAYLTEKGLDTVLARRSKEGHRGGRVRESFSRDAKALVRVAGTGYGNERGSSALVDRAIGLPLEIVADEDLFVDGGDGTRTFRVLYLGQPLAGALVFAMRPGTTDEPVSTRTDQAGRAQLKLSNRGAWRIATIHMVKPPKDIDADWDSLWASLTFDLPAAPADARASTATAASSTQVPSSPASPWPTDTRCQNQLLSPALQVHR